MWLGYLEILKICDKYKQKSILNLKDNKLLKFPTLKV